MIIVAGLFSPISNLSACRAITPRPPNYIFVVRLHSTLNSMINAAYSIKRNHPIRIISNKFLYRSPVHDFAQVSKPIETSRR